MNKKGIIIFAVFLIAFIVPHLFLRYMNMPGQLALLAFIPILFSVSYLIRSITLLIEKRYKDLLPAFFISLLFFLLALKIEYSIYNVFIAILLCMLGSIYLFRRGIKESNQTILCFLLLINFAGILVPDKALYGYIWNKKTWSADLTWDSYKHPPDLSSEYDAETSTELHYKINYAYNYPPALVIALLDEQNSWTKVQSANLLLHEKGHWNIDEVYTRRALDSIKAAFFKRPSEIDAILNYFINECNKQHQIYDSETEHNHDQVDQKKWTLKLEQLLKNE